MTQTDRTDALRGALVERMPAPVVKLGRRVWAGLHPVSMVTREPGAVRWFRRAVLRQKPVLYHFEIHITDHCNLNCKGCAHFSNLCAPSFADIEEFETDMRAMARNFSAVRQIYLLGGEPLLHPRVTEFVRSSRDIFPRTRIYLMTNGTLVMKMEDEFWEALAESQVTLLCDAYPIGLPVQDIDARGREFGATVEWTRSRTEFFKIPIDLAGGNDPAASFDACQGYNNCPIVRDGRLYPCAYVAYADVFSEYFGLEGLHPTEKDSVDVRDAEDPDALMEFLSSPVPWCAHCNASARTFFAWGRSRRDMSEWVEDPSGIA